MDKVIAFLKSLWTSIVGFFRKEDSPAASTPVTAAPAPTSTPAAPAPTQSPAPVPAPADADPFGKGFANRAAFDVWVAQFDQGVNLDGALIHTGFSPAVSFATQADGSIKLA